ncbi:SdrD B-like domain-containing protein, partial [Phaeodactylibacter xiamenensis]|uniref:SdrD B-like domain-containing protein n=2 Tax=Phaeodactylibacter xiamenensis TaxID=1524460 RepID=UPI00136261AC
MKRVGLLTFVLALFWVFQGRAQTSAAGEIELSYNSNVIASGSTTISTGAGTDYGVGFIGNDANLHPSIEYHISNTDTLGIINVSNIYFDGDNSTDFSISGITFPMAIGAGESISFMVTFAPVSALSGPEDLTPVDMDRVAELHVISNDLDESDYTFSIGGMAAGEATVQVGVEIAGETYDDIHGYYTFANIAEELLATYSRTGADGIKTVLGVVDTVFGCGGNRGVGTHPSSDDAILTINPQGVLPDQRWYFFFDDNSVAGYPVRNTTGYAGIGTTLYTGTGTGTALLSGVGLDGAYTDYLFFVEPAYEAIMGNTPTTFTNLELLGEYYADTIFLDSRVLISDPDLQVLNAGQGFYNGSTLQIERQGGANADDYFQLEESILFSLRNDSIFTQEYYIGQYDNTGHQITLNFEGSSQVIVSQRMLNDIVQRITYYNANGVTAPLSFSYVFDDGTSETTGIKTVNPNTEEVFYVDINATGLNNGTSWVNAYNSLQDALARASSGDQVWVAAGEYLPTSGTDREASFRVASGVSIYGSLPSGASALTAQDTAAYPTILSGNIGDPATNTDNVYNVVTFGPVSDFTLLKGLHITGGYADRSDNFFYGNGAGVFNSNFATDSTSGVVLQDLMLYGNTAVLNGGAVYSNGSIWISGCNIFQNEAEDGGAVYNGGIIRISSCDISQNQAVDGSGIYNDNAVVAFSGTNCVLRDVKIHHNTAGDDGGGIASKEAISVYDCDISNNEIDGSGGACYFDLDEGTLGDSIRIVRTKLNNNLLTDTEGEGTAVYTNSDCPVPPVVLFAECLVQGNEGEDGTFYFDVDGGNGDIIVFLESCLFSGNTVYDDGAALMGSDDTQFWVYNTTFAGNYADDDGCVIETGSSSKATLYNCISFGNDANDGSDGIIDAAGDIDIFNCYFEHGEDRMSVDGDLSVNTLFTADDFEDAAFEDFTFDAVNDTPTAEGNFALSKISPLVNLGDNGYATNLEKDLAGNARLQEGTVDLGAYELSPLFFAGLGTAASPYQIKDWEHLHNVRFRMDAHFILINDLDKNSSGYQEYVADSGWLPIGTMDGDVLNGTGTVTGFTGHFDGQGYSINNLQIDNGLSYGNGLFFALGAFEGANLMKADEEDFFPSVIVDPSFLDSLQSLGGAMVHNLKLDSATVGSSIMFSGDNLPLFPNGILAGFVHNSQIDSISASGTVRMGGGVVGAVLESQATNTQLSFLTTHIENELLGAGIAGCLGINTLVTDSRAHIQSSDQGLPVGISLLNAGAVSRCFATVTSTLATPSPPFLPSGISWLLSGKIEESAAQVNFSFGAGLAAFSLSGQINNAYVTGNIAQGAGVVYQNSGLVGNTYVAIETDSVAGLFGINSGMVSNSFWDAELAGLSESAAGEGKTTCEMKAADLFTAAGWDFEGETNNGNEEIWRIVDSASTVSYPYLSALTYDAIGAVPEVNPIPGLDTLLPTAVCMDITAYLDASGEASIMPGDIGAGSMISCDTLTLSLSQTAFSCDEQGENTVVLTTTDSANNTDTCSAIVTVLDTIAPVASCTDLTVYLDNAGEGTISPAQADGGSTDNCGSVSLSLSDSTFTCDDLSLNTEAILGSSAGFRSPQSASGVSVVLIATDGSDNIDSCMLTVTVLDTIAPVASCTDLTVYLDNAGEGNISAAQADGGSTDNCGSVSLSLSDSTFTCGDLGQQEVTLIVTEGATASSGSDSCMSMITVLDTIAPVASCTDLTVYLDNAGEGTISAAQADGGSADNCGSVSLSLSDSTFTCGDLGQQEVTLIVTEGATAASGSGSCMSMITVLDTIAPVASCTDLTVYLDNAGEGTISAAQADGGSTDNCGSVSLSLSDSTFTCDDLSLNTDAILDSGEGFRSPQSASGVSVVLIATDGSDNIDSCMLTVTVLDTISPVMACTDVPVLLDEMGAASIDVSDVDTGTTDNCGTPMLQLSQTSFSCSDIGEVSVSLTATDGSGNSNSCEVTVTVSGPDADCDGDGLTNAEEDELGTDSFAADTDGDGVIDGTEVSDMTSPTDACSFVLGSQSVAPATDWNMSDCDGDGLTNAEEADTYSTNPLEADTDGDGVTDGSEVADSSSPLEICDYVYSSVTLPKGEAWADADCDGDGLSNEVEGDETTDTDGDLIPDCFDLDSDNDGLLDATEQGTEQDNGNTAALAMFAADIDGDSILNFRDVDSDGDGCFDAVEASDDLTPADLDSEGRIPGGVDENGVPLTAGMEGFAAAEAWSSNEIAGEFCGSDIGGYVWLDNDRNGFFSQDGNTDAAPVLAALGEAYANLPDNENTLPGVQVRLYGTDLNGNPVDEVQTADADGYYLFELVLGGDYCMEISFEGLDSAEDYVLTIPDVEGDALDEQDSDYSLEGELCFTLEAGAASVYDLNAGVFLDADGDFIPDVIDPDIGGEMLDPQGFIYCENTGEIISGATIEVTGPGNVTMVADGSTGFYQWFVDASGTYTMTLNAPAGYGISTDCTDSGQLDPEPGITIVGSSEEAMSGFMEDASCGANPFYMEFVLSPGDLVLNNNLPLVCAEIGNRAWKDFDRDGLQSPGEPGLGYTEVRLLDCAGNGVDTVVSDIEGRFLFTGLPAGGYVLDYEGRAEWAGSLPNLWSYAGYQAGAAELDSDITASGSTECVTLGVGEKNYTVDGGYEVPYTYSCNCDGSITLEWSPISGEPGVTYTVDIEDSAGNPVLDYVNMTETSVTIAHGTLQNGEEYRLAITENISTSNVVSITGPLYADCNPVPMASVISAAGPACPGGTDGSVSFELEESGCAGRYALYLEQAGSDILVAADTTLANSFSVSGLGEGSYSLRVELLDTLSCGYGVGCFPLEVEDFVSLSNQDMEGPSLEVSAQGGVGLGSGASFTYTPPEGECGVQLEWLAEVSDNCTAGDAIALSVNIESDVAGVSPWAAAVQTSSGYAVSVHAGIGTNTVVLTATDEAGNSTELSYEITVVDSRAPEIYGPGDMQVQIPGCEDSAPVNWQVSAIDDCSLDVELEQVSGPQPGDVLAPGVYTVVYEATDGYGNTSQYSFDITLTQAQSPAPVVDVSGNGQFVIEDCAEDGFIVFSGHIYDCELQPGDVLDGLISISGAPLELTYILVNEGYAYFEATGSLSAGSYLIVTSYEGVTIDHAVEVVQDADTPAVMTMPGNLAYQVPNCEGEAAVSFAVQLEDDCDEDFSSASFTVNGAPAPPFDAALSDPANGYFAWSLSLSPGVYTIVGTYTDGGGNTTEATATVTVNADEDNSAPIIVYPSQNINIALDPCLVDAVASQTFQVTATDNCDGDLDPTVSVSAGTGSVTAVPGGYVFMGGPGVHTITITATDAAGNSRTESFSINVTQAPAPQENLACNDNINVTLDDNCSRVITADMVLEGNFGCLEESDFAVNIVNDDNPANGNILDGHGQFIYEIDLAGQAQPIEGFTGDFASGNWAILQQNGGTVNFAANGSSVSFVSPNGGFCPGGAEASVAIAMPSDGNLTFDWSYSTVDLQFYDPFLALIDPLGNVTVLVNNQTTGQTSGTVDVDVVAGSVLAMGAVSLDCLFGSSTTVVSNFVFSPVAADLAGFEPCWGYITGEDKTAPVVECPDNTAVATISESVQKIQGALETTDAQLELADYSCFLDGAGPLAGDHYYDIIEFQVSADDIYTIYLNTSWGDGFTALYQGSFDADSPCENILYAADDNILGNAGPIGGLFDPQVRVTLPLRAYETYFVLVSSFGSDVTGSYEHTIFSDGNGLVGAWNFTETMLPDWTIQYDTTFSALPSTTEQLSIPLFCDDFGQIYGGDAGSVAQETAFISGTYQWVGAPSATDNCDDNVDITATDSFTSSGDCGDVVITRTFTAIDGQGLTDECQQQITIRKPTLDDVNFPSFTAVVECDEDYPALANGNP